MKIGRREFLRLTALATAGTAFGYSIGGTPEVQYGWQLLNNPELLGPFGTDLESGKILGMVDEIKSSQVQLPPQQQLARGLVSQRKQLIDGGQSNGQLSLKIDYTVPTIDPKTLDKKNGTVGQAITLVDPFSTQVKSVVAWGDPGDVKRLLNSVPIDKTDAVGILTHEVLGHTHIWLVQFLNFLQQGSSGREIAAKLNNRSDQGRNEEREAWFIEILGAYLFQKLQNKKYEGVFYDPKWGGIDDLGLIDYWFKQLKEFSIAPWDEIRMRWILERMGAIIALRNAAVKNDFSQLPILPLSIHDDQLDVSFLTGAQEFFTDDSLAKSYKIDMDPTEKNPWIKKHLPSTTSGFILRVAREVERETHLLL